VKVYIGNITGTEDSDSCTVCVVGLPFCYAAKYANILIQALHDDGFLSDESTVHGCADCDNGVTI
jgi:hypothetical protein